MRDEYYRVQIIEAKMEKLRKDLKKVKARIDDQGNYRGYDPERSNIKTDALAEFIVTPITGDLYEVS